MDNEWVFTFGIGQRLGGRCVRIKGTYEEARQKMVDVFGNKWAFQYAASQWDEWKKDPSRAWRMEKDIKIEGLE